MSVPPLQGYRKKPRAILVIALGFLVIPAALMLQTLFLTGGSWQALGAVMSSRYFLQEWWLSWSAAAAVAIVSRWSFAYLLLLSGYVLITKLGHLTSHPHLETPVSLCITAFWFSVALLLLGSSLKAPYLNPKLRWWTRPIRLSLCRHAAVSVRGTTIPVAVLNLSRGGAFVTLDESATASQAPPCRLGESVELTMDLTPGKQTPELPAQFSVRAQLVWMSKPDSPYRHGLGIRFLPLSRAQQRQLHRYLHAARQTASPAGV
ncbi:MAG: PilZ domain-containing protein [Candidatus Omnitrophota bacterium]|nr:PilZ domain-containing protein [Candidatus Omnitrophota bacterium]